jgi:hypothetical protein
VDDGNLANDLPDWWPYPVQCGHGHPWSPGHVIVSYLPCACRADEGISGHTVVHCTTDGCRSAWYRPRHHPPDATPPDTAGEPDIRCSLVVKLLAEMSCYQAAAGVAVGVGKAIASS